MKDLKRLMHYFSIKIYFTKNLQKIDQKDKILLQILCLLEMAVSK